MPPAAEFAFPFPTARVVPGFTAVCSVAEAGACGTKRSDEVHFHEAGTLARV
jgi:hypothetical protein